MREGSVCLAKKQVSGLPLAFGDGARQETGKRAIVGGHTDSSRNGQFFSGLSCGRARTRSRTRSHPQATVSIFVLPARFRRKWRMAFVLHGLCAAAPLRVRQRAVFRTQANAGAQTAVAAAPAPAPKLKLSRMTLKELRDEVSEFRQSNDYLALIPEHSTTSDGSEPFLINFGHPVVSTGRTPFGHRGCWESQSSTHYAGKSRLPLHVPPVCASRARIRLLNENVTETSRMSALSAVGKASPKKA